MNPPRTDLNAFLADVRAAAARHGIDAHVVSAGIVDGEATHNASWMEGPADVVLEMTRRLQKRVISGIARKDIASLFSALVESEPDTSEDPWS